MTDRLDRRSLAALARLGGAAALLLWAPASLAAGSGLLVSGSAYVDYWGIPDKDAAPKAPASFTIDAAIKLGVDVTDDVSFSAKACVSCHGIEFEHISIDYAPASWFNVTAGRLLVPFGEFSQRLDPSGHKTTSAPLIYDMGHMAYGERSAMNLGVIPQPYTDTGVLLYGTKWLGEILQFWYGAYAVSGFKGSNDIDWIAMRQVYYQDNNRQPAYGGRITASFASEPHSFIGDVSFGVSATKGVYDKAEKLGYLMYGADASARVGPFTMRGEYVLRRTDLNPAASGYPYQLVDDWFNKEGWYAELEHPLGKYIAMVYRYDELRRAGAPLPGSSPLLTTDSKIVRYTAGAMITPAQNTFVKLSWERWEPTDFPAFQSYHVGVGGAF